MKTLAEVLAAIKTLSPDEKDEIKLYLRELAAKEAQKAVAENPKPKPQAPLGAKPLQNPVRKISSSVRSDIFNLFSEYAAPMELYRFLICGYKDCAPTELHFEFAD